VTGNVEERTVLTSLKADYMGAGDKTSQSEITYHANYHGKNHEDKRGGKREASSTVLTRQTRGRNSATKQNRITKKIKKGIRKTIL